VTTLPRVPSPEGDQLCGQLVRRVKQNCTEADSDYLHWDGEEAAHASDLAG